MALPFVLDTIYRVILGRLSFDNFLKVVKAAFCSRSRSRHKCTEEQKLLILLSRRPDHPQPLLKKGGELTANTKYGLFCIGSPPMVCERSNQEESEVVTRLEL